MSASEFLPKKPRSHEQTEQAFEKNPRLRVCPITYPEELPVSARRNEIAQAIQNHQVIVVCGETGSGKTTQLPKICLELGRGQNGLIGHTQPRRIAASTTANRIARELHSPIGDIVGYKIRFTDRLSAHTVIKLMTDGILLAETQQDRLLKQYDTIIIDEAHERSLNIDFLLGYLKQILPQRPDLKLIITSATIDAERFARHFSTEKTTVPIIEVSGRLYPVEIRYRPILFHHDSSMKEKAPPNSSRDGIDAIVDAVDEVLKTGPGDILVFLPGEREIRETADALGKQHTQPLQILPLYARLSAQEQEKVFKSGGVRKLILATNVAETSLTVPGIRFVIDTGLARVKRYSYRNKVEQLHSEPISQAAANQRAGRCGRVASGICIRLYDEQDYALRPPYTTPEILRSSLASVILKMKSLKLGNVETFPFMEPPLKKAIADGYQLLQELGALDERNQMTSIGQELAMLPLDPRIGRMILAANQYHCVKEMLIIASALSIQDPRDRPIDAQEAADHAHQKFAHKQSEFMAYLKIWNWFDEALKNKQSNRLLRETCRNQFLSFLRLREWRDIHDQLRTLIHERRWRLNATDATYEQVHLALLTGLLGNIGCKTEDTSVFLGARGIRFQIWPGSALARKNGRWIMASELVDTTRLYARGIALIQPEWLERTGGHLLKKSWNDPHWEKRPAHVSAFERATLYGLVVYHQRRIHYGQINPTEARQIFIREALVHGNYETKAPFFAHNQQVMRDIENLEHQSRRADVLIDEDLIVAFYDQHLPASIINGFSFEKWHRDAVKDNPRLLFFDRADLMRHDASGITTDAFPKTLTMAGIDMPLHYHFEPGNARDGITLTIPIHALNQLDEHRCEWLVIGMLKEKVHALLKSLPQKIRRNCVPLPDYAAQFTDRILRKNAFGSGALINALIDDIREQTGVIVKRDDFREETLPRHLFMNFNVVDEHHRMLDMSRHLASLQSDWGKQASNAFQRLAQLRTQPKTEKALSRIKTESEAPLHDKAHLSTGSEKITTWNFDPLPEYLEITKEKHVLIGYPALVDEITHCTLAVFDDPFLAKHTHYAGLRRLFALHLKDQLKFLGKNLTHLTQMGLLFIKLGSQEELCEQILLASLNAAFMYAPLPNSAAAFEHRKNEGKTRMGLLCNEIAKLVQQILTEYQAIQKKLPTIKSHEDTLTDIHHQLSQLISKQFITETPLERLRHFPRYMKACLVRIEKCRHDPQRDQRLFRSWQQAALPYDHMVKDKKRNRLKADTKLTEYRWLLEELRVSLFAQELRTPFPVSVKRLQKIREAMQQ